MTLYTNYKKIGDEIAKKIAKCPKVKAVAYIGSMATGFLDEISKDIDLVCIVDKLPSIEERRNYLGNQKYLEGIPTIHLETFMATTDVRVDIIFKEFQWFENVFEKNNTRR
jgi:predicted nucleotidyltransferase